MEFLCMATTKPGELLVCPTHQSLAGARFSIEDVHLEAFLASVSASACWELNGTEVVEGSLEELTSHIRARRDERVNSYILSIQAALGGPGRLLPDTPAREFSSIVVSSPLLPAEVASRIKPWRGLPPDPGSPALDVAW